MYEGYVSLNRLVSSPICYGARDGDMATSSTSVHTEHRKAHDVPASSGFAELGLGDPSPHTIDTQVLQVTMLRRLLVSKNFEMETSIFQETSVCVGLSSYSWPRRVRHMGQRYEGVRHAEKAKVDMVIDNVEEAMRRLSLIGAANPPLKIDKAERIPIIDDKYRWVLSFKQPQSRERPRIKRYPHVHCGSKKGARRHLARALPSVGRSSFRTCD